MPPHRTPTHLFVFADAKCIARGSVADVFAELRARTDETPYLVFDEQTGELIDFDVHNRAGAAPSVGSAPPREETPRGVGRPKLGVVAREVTLLPRHWDWLGRQPGGASVALRKLVDDARRVHVDRDQVRASREAAYRFMSSVAGHLPHFEEASRALFAGDSPRFDQQIADWPQDIRTDLARLSARAWTPE